MLRNIPDISSVLFFVDSVKQIRGTIRNYSIAYNKKIFIIEIMKTHDNLLKGNLPDVEVIIQIDHNLIGKTNTTNLSTKLFDLTLKNIEDFSNEGLLFTRYEYSFVAFNNDNIYMTEKQKKDLFPYLLSGKEEKEVK